MVRLGEGLWDCVERVALALLARGILTAGEVVDEMLALARGR